MAEFRAAELEHSVRKQGTASKRVQTRLFKWAAAVAAGLAVVLIVRQQWLGETAPAPFAPPASTVQSPTTNTAEHLVQQRSTLDPAERSQTVLDSQTVLQPPGAVQQQPIRQPASLPPALKQSLAVGMPGERVTWVGYQVADGIKPVTNSMHAAIQAWKKPSAKENSPEEPAPAPNGSSGIWAKSSSYV